MARLSSAEKKELAALLEASGFVDAIPVKRKQRREYPIRHAGEEKVPFYERNFQNQIGPGGDDEVGKPEPTIKTTARDEHAFVDRHYHDVFVDPLGSKIRQAVSGRANNIEGMGGFNIMSGNTSASAANNVLRNQLGANDTTNQFVTRNYGINELRQHFAVK